MLMQDRLTCFHAQGCRRVSEKQLRRASFDEPADFKINKGKENRMQTTAAGERN